MNNPLVHAFFLGRAFAETLSEQAANTATYLLSELGKFDAEQRDRLRLFTEEVMERAQQAEAVAMQNRPVTANGSTSQPADLQALIDDLRAETAQLRAELQRYRSGHGYGALPLSPHLPTLHSPSL